MNKKIKINIIANNFEKYMSFRSGKHLQFIDSFQFMSQSLDKLSSNLPENRFIYTGGEIDGDLELMKKKGVYPYDFMDSFDRFNETELPKRKMTQISLKKSINMLEKFGILLKSEILVNIMTYI